MALAVWVGAATFRLWIVPALPLGEAGRIQASMERLIAVCFLVLCATSVASLALRIAVMSGEPMFRGLLNAPQVVLHTHYGPVWALRPVALAVLAAAWFAARRNSLTAAPWVAVLVASAIYAASRSASGHPADAGDFSLQELLDWLHLMSISAWLGGVFVSLWIVFPRLPRWVATDPNRAAEFARRFSRSSALALVVVLATGLYNTFVRLASVASLVNSEYGRTLSVKLVLVACTIVVGAINRNVYVRRLCAAPDGVADRAPGGEPLRDERGADVPAEAGGWRSSTYFARNVAVEAGLMISTLIVVGSLLQGMPPHIMPDAHASGASARETDGAFTFGRPAPTSTAPRTVNVELFDANRCVPGIIRVGPGEIVRFDVTNHGTSDHEFVIGDAEEQQQHEAHHAHMGHMDMPDMANSLNLAPGQSKSIVWQFEGIKSFACVSLG
jgi:copper resistance protein D